MTNVGTASLDGFGGPENSISLKYSPFSVLLQECRIDMRSRKPDAISMDAIHRPKLSSKRNVFADAYFSRQNLSFPDLSTSDLSPSRRREIDGVSNCDGRRGGLDPCLFQKGKKCPFLGKNFVKLVYL